jgi:hypothetical protein
VFQILLSAKFGDPPARELPPQKAAEQFSQLEPFASTWNPLIPRSGKIHQRNRSLALAEAFNSDLQPPATLIDQPGNPPDEVPLFGPALQCASGPAVFECHVLAQQRQGIFTRFNQDWLMAGREKTLDRPQSLFRRTA